MAYHADIQARRHTSRWSFSKPPPHTLSTSNDFADAQTILVINSPGLHGFRVLGEQRVPKSIPHTGVPRSRLICIASRAISNPTKVLVVSPERRSLKGLSRRRSVPLSASIVIRNTSLDVATARYPASPEADKHTERPRYCSPTATANSAAFPACRREKWRTVIDLGWFDVRISDWVTEFMTMKNWRIRYGGLVES
ncbi:hypothetical protein BDZ94DRAFT_797859 [Collybia nuda]|uniref:Uncharacterized protein n=1 Tax=Collybia nuda TaxID=64659 RepID=A0A9P6CDG1_9AGAR|nr:hypothetical protein BDZ94DRAFT_797859 [Collybia nuda]